MIKFSITQQDFLQNYHGKQPKIFRQAIINNQVNWQYVNEFLTRSDIEQDYFQLSYDGIVAKTEYIESFYDLGILKHRFIRPALYSYLQKGATLTANRIVNEPIINAYARQIEQFTGCSTICSAYIAFGEKSSFRPHWDSRDIFVLQTIGKKRWVIYPPSFENPLYLHKSLHMGEQYPCPSEPILDIELEAGDILYLPRGWWHDPLPLGQETVHLTIAIYPPSGLDYVEWVFNKLPNLHDISEARQNLSQWQNDQQKVQALAQKLSEFMVNPSNYDAFMQEFMANKRVESNLALEVLGNAKLETLPQTAVLRLNSHQHYDESSEYIIANGTKLNLDSELKPLLVYIAQHHQVALADIIQHFSHIDEQKIKTMLYRLCVNDIMEVVSY